MYDFLEHNREQFHGFWVEEECSFLCLFKHSTCVEVEGQPPGSVLAFHFILFERDIIPNCVYKACSGFQGVSYLCSPSPLLATGARGFQTCPTVPGFPWVLKESYHI